MDIHEERKSEIWRSESVRFSHSLSYLGNILEFTTTNSFSAVYRPPGVSTFFVMNGSKRFRTKPCVIRMRALIRFVDKMCS